MPHDERLAPEDRSDSIIKTRKTMPRVNLGIFAAVCAACFLFGFPAYPQNTKSARAPGVGSVKGVPITAEDLNKAAANDLQRAELQHLQAEANYARAKHLALEKALAQLIEDKVLDAEAAHKGLTKQALLDKELAGKVKEPTPEDLDAHYPPDKRLTGDSRDNVFARMKQVLKTENYNKAKAVYVAQLKKKYGVTESLKPFRLTVDTEGSPSIGPDAAPITVVDFSDFQCSSCGSFEKSLRDLQKKYGGQVRLVFRNFAHEQPYAEMAAEAALCAGDQGRFWEMHDSLFQTGRPEPQYLNLHAARLNLNLQEFGACLMSGRHAESVKRDLFAAAGLGVTNAPAVFVNGRPVLALRTVEDIAEVIDEELQSPAQLAKRENSPIK